MGGNQCGVGDDHRATPEGGGGLGAAADPVDGGADVRVAWEMPSVEQGPGEERPIVGGVCQVGYDPHDAQPACAQRNGCRVPLSNGCINPLMGQTLSTTEELPSIAACRHVEPRTLSGLVRGELDWIVMKALEKDRNRRYETANGLAADLRRYL